MNFIDVLEYPNFEYPSLKPEELLEKLMAEVSSVAGQYARFWQVDGDVVMARDPLGVNKLFYGYNGVGDLVVASRIERALKLGVHLDSLASCPPGYVVRICENGTQVVKGEDVSSVTPDKDFDLDRCREEVLSKIEAVMGSLNTVFPDKTFVVCLSGGLDSSAVASLARKYLKRVVAVSFSFLSETDTCSWLGGTYPEKLESASEDFLSALQVARALEIPFFPVFRTSSAVISVVPTAVRLCQDWRDFNVHCAVVNLFLAQEIRALFPEGEVVVLTGDLMNEFVCDYREEVIDGTVYYPQPRIPIEKRRRFFVRGLDAGDREVGVFNAFGLPVCQIFSTVAKHYLGVPNELLSRPDIKKTLNDHLLTPTVRDKVNKFKRRAQVGGADGGTLGVFHRFGMDQRRLRELWIRALPLQMRGDNPLDIIQCGRYRTTPRKV